MLVAVKLFIHPLLINKLMCINRVLKLLYQIQPILVFAIVFFCANATTFASEEVIVGQSDDEVITRLSFIQNRFKKGSLHAQLWQYGWLGGFSTSLAARSYVAATGKGDNRFDATVGIFTSLSAVMSLTLNPLPSSFAVSELAKLPENTPEQRLKKLKYAEWLLDASAKEAKRRRGWKIQGVFLLEQLLAGLAIGLIDNRPSDGLKTAAIGMLASEIFTFTMPTNAITDYEAYSNASFISQKKITKRTKNINLLLLPKLGGIKLVYLF